MLQDNELRRVPFGVRFTSQAKVNRSVFRRLSLTQQFDLDLGDDHQLSWISWAPDRSLNPRYAEIPNIDKVGAVVAHFTPQGQPCDGYIEFDSPERQKLVNEHGWRDRPKWTVESWEPLTLSPSLLCQCGDHGFIRGGRWVRA